MPEITVDVEIWCECGEGLCFQSSTATKGTGVVVEPCLKCLASAEEEAHGEGYERGDDDGYNRGVAETEERVGGC